MTHDDQLPDMCSVRLEEIVLRVCCLFDCKSFVLAKEEHKESGYHFHIGILNTSAHRKTLIGLIVVA